MDDPSLVRIERPFDGCALVTLNRPRAMNALSLALRRELAAAFDDLRRDAAVGVVVLTGAGAAFCAGLDLKELGASADAKAALVPSPEQDPVRAMAAFAGPIIGAVNGAAITGGFELALACDLLVASSAARFADTHARVGVLPGWGLSQKLPRLIGLQRAKEMSLTGNFIDAAQAEAWGLVNRVVAPSQLLPQALTLAHDMLSAVPGMLGAYKSLIDDGFGATLADGMRLERRRSADWAAGAAAADIEQRRHAIRARGRSQQGTAPGEGSDPPD